MKNRPIPLVLLALFQILAPLGTLLFNSWVLGVKPGYVLHWMLQGSPLQIFESLFLMPLAGVAIYLMKPWSYVLFLAAMGWGLLNNLAAWHYAQNAKIGIPWLFSLYAIQVVIAIYFMLPSVRRAYLDPRVRWWEAQKRILFQCPVRGMHLGVPVQGKILNLSEGGAFLAELQSDIKQGDTLQLKFEVVGIRFETRADVVYLSPTGIGVRFAASPEMTAALARLVQGLVIIGVPFRDQDETGWLTRLFKWGTQLIFTGRGFTPEFDSARRIHRA